MCACDSSWLIPRLSIRLLAFSLFFQANQFSQLSIELFTSSLFPPTLTNCSHLHFFGRLSSPLSHSHFFFFQLLLLLLHFQIKTHFQLSLVWFPTQNHWAGLGMETSSWWLNYRVCWAKTPALSKCMVDYPKAWIAVSDALYIIQRNIKLIEIAMR